MGNTTLKNETQEVDFSNISFINDIWIVKPAPEIIIEVTAFLPLVIFGIFGNLLSLYVLCKNQHICTPTNILIGNMALADLLSLSIHPWVFLIYDFFQNYQFGSFGCKTEATAECAILITSVINVSAISYDRLIAILLPRESKLTKRGAKMVMVATWLAGILIASPLFVYRKYKERQWKDFLEKYCTEDIFVTNIYWHVIITVLVWIPLVIQLICYTSIFIKLHRYEKIASERLKSRQVNYKKKAVRMMFTIIVTFLICRMPFTALIFYRDSNQKHLEQNMARGTFHIMWFLSKFFIFANSAVNPVIYSLTNEKFQKGLKQTKLIMWIFPPIKSKPKHIIIQKENVKTLETSTIFKKNVFLILKKKQKQSTDLTEVGTNSVMGKYENIHKNNILQ